MLTHRNLVFMSQCYYADIDRLDERDTHLLAAPVSHGAGLYALPFLLKGAHQIVLPHFDVDGDFRRGRPASARVDVRGADDADPARPCAGRSPPPTWRICARSITAAGRCTWPISSARSQIFGPRLYQLYGQGESPMTITGLAASACTPSATIRAGTTGSAHAVCRAPASSSSVVDDQDHELPPGEIGEVITRSDCVMDGYWKNPAANAETLRGGWLHTGDLGSIDADGFLTLRDRSKDMIISGGSNIYPREIEEVLLRHRDVVEVSVVGRPHPDWGEEVVAFLVARPGATVAAGELDRLCLDHIARFKRPRALPVCRRRCPRTITARS